MTDADLGRDVSAPLPCPFCGGEAKSGKTMRGPVMRWICCAACGAYSSAYASAKSALTAWNARPAPAPAAPPTRPMAEAPRDGTPILAQFFGRWAFAVVSPQPSSLGKLWVIGRREGRPYIDDDFAGWWPLPGGSE